MHRRFTRDTRYCRRESKRELGGFLTSATHSTRCTEQGIEVDFTPFGAFALRYFARQALNLINLWLGHSQNLMDLYAAQLRFDVAYHREWCEKVGLGFELGELGYKLGAPIRPSLVA
jgi:hypothetical protein